MHLMQTEERVNSVFQPLQWLYFYNRLELDFRWCTTGVLPSTKYGLCDPKVKKRGTKSFQMVWCAPLKWRVTQGFQAAVCQAAEGTAAAVVHMPLLWSLEIVESWKLVVCVNLCCHALTWVVFPFLLKAVQGQARRLLPLQGNQKCYVLLCAFWQCDLLLVNQMVSMKTLGVCRAKQG